MSYNFLDSGKGLILTMLLHCNRNRLLYMCYLVFHVSKRAPTCHGKTILIFHHNLLCNYSEKDRTA